MIVCDGCKSEQCKPVEVSVTTPDVKKRGRARTIIKIDMACCEKCIDRLLKRMGQMRKYHEFFIPLSSPVEVVAT